MSLTSAVVHESRCFSYNSATRIFKANPGNHIISHCPGCVCGYVFVWVNEVLYCTRLCSNASVPLHCSLRLSCQFSLVWRLTLLQPFSCALPGILPFWSWKWEGRLEERTGPGQSVPVKEVLNHGVNTKLFKISPIYKILWNSGTEERISLALFGVYDTYV